MRRLVHFILAFFLFSITALSADPVKVPEPTWVKRIGISDSAISEGATGYQYLLYDVQDHLDKEQGFRHYAVKVLSTEGVQEMSDISASFDPTYQQLRFHGLTITRGAEVIDKLPRAKIDVFQRESNMENALYDGTETAVIHLSDVRVGDVIEYSYSVSGFNPINSGHYQRSYYTKLTIPVNRISIRVLTKSELFYKTFHDASSPRVSQIGGLSEYLVERSALDYLVYDNNVPAWYDPLDRISFSTHRNWASVVEWALPLYAYDSHQVPSINHKSIKKADRILEIVRLVQDDIRYLGLEEGIGAYMPHRPDEVFEQRYGDCKDKSLLLVSLMRKLGIEAYPVLVNTTSKGQLEVELPGNVFNHCIVGYTVGGEWNFVDPTISSQGGSIDKLHFPDYEKGLMIKAGTNELIDISKPAVPMVFIQEFVTVEEIGGQARLRVKTEYTGERADYMRSYFNNASKDVVEKEYLNFYSALYPSVEIAEPLEFVDNTRETENRVIVTERYLVPDIWETSADEGYSYLEVYPLVLESLISYSKSAKRKMPYHLGNPLSFAQETVIELPEDWSFEKDHKVIKGSGFRYENEVSGSPNRIKVTHRYDLLQHHIAGNEVDQFIRDHNEIQNELSFILTRNDQVEGGFQLSMVSLMITVMAFAIGVWLAAKLYLQYDPEPWQFAEDKPVGGWLILPAVGLIITPLMLLMQVFDPAMFDQNTWAGLAEFGDHTLGMYLFVGGELVYNAFYLILTLLVIVLFFQRRTSLPKVISVFYVVSFVGPLVDNLLVEVLMGNYVFDQSDQVETYREIGRSVIAAAIWVPYFNIAQRVKSTFCKTRSSISVG